MKRSTSGRGIEAELESKKSSATRATTELNDPSTESSRRTGLDFRKRNCCSNKGKGQGHSHLIFLLANSKIGYLKKTLDIVLRFRTKIARDEDDSREVLKRQQTSPGVSKHT
ncbi:hypothetical protein Dimus_027453 [Dionaea muscipula]